MSKKAEKMLELTGQRAKWLKLCLSLSDESKKAEKMLEPADESKKADKLTLDPVLSCFHNQGKCQMPATSQVEQKS